MSGNRETQWEALAKRQAEQFTLTTQRYRGALQRIRGFPHLDPFTAAFIDGILDPADENHESDDYESLGAFDFTQEDG